MDGQLEAVVDVDLQAVSSGGYWNRLAGLFCVEQYNNEGSLMLDVFPRPEDKLGVINVPQQFSKSSRIMRGSTISLVDLG